MRPGPSTACWNWSRWECLVMTPPVIPGAPRSGKGAQSMGMHFDRNEENPLDADVIIIDEMSMVDISLMHSPAAGSKRGHPAYPGRGDVDQLPSVGPGNVLRDIIESGSFNVVKLTHIFRQAAQSDIVVNAHKINAGEPVDLAKRSQDFPLYPKGQPGCGHKRGHHPDPEEAARLCTRQCLRYPGSHDAHAKRRPWAWSV